MTRPSIVAVYGFPGAAEQESRRARTPVRLGTGSLEEQRIVVLDDQLSRELSSANPPEVLRVGIAGRLDGEPFVEVVEVLGVLSSSKRTQWAAELVTPASSPTVWDIRSLDAGVPVGPGNGICFFYRASFC